MNAKLLSGRFWALVIMTVATSAAMLLRIDLPTQWWGVYSVVIGFYFGRNRPTEVK